MENILKYLFIEKAGAMGNETNCNGMVILLTATVNVNGCAFLRRADPEIRKTDYKKSLALWLEKTECKIVFCENSNSDLSFLDEVLNTEEKRNRVELLSFDGNSYNRGLGKGYGEVETISYAIDNSEFLKNFSYVLKVTGRYFCSKLLASLKTINYEQFDFIAHERKIAPMTKHNAINSLFFGAKKQFYINSIKPKQKKINDSKHVYFEHILFRVWNNMPKDKRVKFQNLGAEGWSGTGNRILNWTKFE